MNLVSSFQPTQRVPTPFPGVKLSAKAPEMRERTSQLADRLIGNSLLAGHKPPPGLCLVQLEIENIEHVPVKVVFSALAKTLKTASIGDQNKRIYLLGRPGESVCFKTKEDPFPQEYEAEIPVEFSSLTYPLVELERQALKLRVKETGFELKASPKRSLTPPPLH